jgi:phospholipid/cholesterol/gamma-HCH transport system substrate-binding protein
MNKSRVETKVGLFVFIALVLLALLLLQFGKSASLFRPMYSIYLTTKSAGGLKKQASVMMAGVPIGSVADIRLAPSGKTVTITLRIFRGIVVRDDAVFLIKQSGFLGDSYVDINPGANAGDELKDGSHAEAQEPFELQEVARSAAGFISRVDEAAKKLNDAISDVRRLVLNEQTLTNLSAAVSSLRIASDKARGAADKLDTLLSTNGAAISQSASNLVVFSEELNRVAGALNGVVATNADSVSASVKNIESSTIVLKSLMDDVKAGKGPVGTLLRDEDVASNVTEIVNNLSITTSNLNRVGLWGILWSKKAPHTNAPARSLQSPKGKSD